MHDFAVDYSVLAFIRSTLPKDITGHERKLYGVYYMKCTDGKKRIQKWNSTHMWRGNVAKYTVQFTHMSYPEHNKSKNKCCHGSCFCYQQLLFLFLSEAAKKTQHYQWSPFGIYTSYRYRVTTMIDVLFNMLQEFTLKAQTSHTHTLRSVKQSSQACNSLLNWFLNRTEIATYLSMTMEDS